MIFTRYELSEPSGLLVVARSKWSVALEALSIAVALGLTLFTVGWFVSVFGVSLFELGSFLILWIVVCGIGGAGYGVWALARAYRRFQRPELLRFDRAADAVIRGGQRICALRDVRQVALQRYVYSNRDGSTVFKVGMVVAAREGVIPVVESGDETEMRICAGRVAGYAGVVIQEI